MFKTLTATAALVVFAGSLAFAGQGATTTAPKPEQKVTTQSQSATKDASAKKSTKKHAKKHKKASKKSGATTAPKPSTAQ